MSETTTPGMLAEHRFVTDNCRETHGEDKAIELAVQDLEAKAKDYIKSWPRGKGHKFHFVLTVERGG